jgi:hypothetical protein
MGSDELRLVGVSVVQPKTTASANWRFRLLGPRANVVSSVETSAFAPSALSTNVNATIRRFSASSAPGECHVPPTA